ncbi:flavodoxin [Bengtsoniella intestinalis]|uniref:flavodoxin n=1 Tax=Bengtsoniella intestinalis TaxID=3073143 RepID=UPI00391FACDA
MSKVAVVFWSGTGNTEVMAECVAEGITAAGKEAVMLQPSEFSLDVAGDYDAVAFGCPSMGAEQLEEGDMQPMWDSVVNGLSGKNVSLFGSYGWGDGEWMRTWEAEAKDGGMNVLETLILNEMPNDDGKDDCRSLGKDLAR